MTPDTATVSVANDSEVMASVDDDGSSKQFVIADVSRENAWICMRVTDTAPLPDWQ